ncbi:MAG: mitochondrial fission ELM1 family protein, partial [Deltaproteobacteria bacterium]|nr:mitochondrial fission ELM1 family protein [Deltaproteobacteria bacterium]
MRAICKLLRPRDHAVLKRDQSPPRAKTDPPSVWLIADERPGNRSQSLGLLDALGWNYLEKKLRCGPLSVLSNRVLGASLIGYDLRRSSELVPPWPDLVIACGRRTAPAALWVRERSAGSTRIVVLGRKAGDAAHLFDLVVTPEYGRGAPHPNRMEIGGPLHRMIPAVLERAREQWGDVLSRSCDAPRIALLVGGTSGQYAFSVAAARELGTRVSKMVHDAGAGLFVSTSRRTGRAQTDALREALGEVAHAFHWSPSAGENPYRGYLACADAFVITADSESMIAEACSTGKPVHVYPLATRVSYRLLKRYRDWAVARAGLIDGTANPRGRIGALCLYLISRGWIRPARDMDLIQSSMAQRGTVRYFGEDLLPPAAAPISEINKV